MTNVLHLPTASDPRGKVLQRLRKEMRAGSAGLDSHAHRGRVLDALGVNGQMFDVREGGETAYSEGGRTLAAVLLAERCQARGRCVWIDDRETAPNALQAVGFQGAEVAWVTSSSDGETLWACEQAAGSGAVEAVVASVSEAGTTDLRRLAVASAKTGTLLILLRPSKSLNGSWADARLVVRKLPTEGDPSAWTPRLRVDVPYRRALGEGPSAVITWGFENDTEPVVSQLADPAGPRRRTPRLPRRLKLRAVG